MHSSAISTRANTTFSSSSRKLSRLELHSIGERTVELIEEVPVWSGIAAIESVKLPVRPFDLVHHCPHHLPPPLRPLLRSRRLPQDPDSLVNVHCGAFWSHLRVPDDRRRPAPAMPRRPRLRRPAPHRPPHSPHGQALGAIIVDIFFFHLACIRLERELQRAHLLPQCLLDRRPSLSVRRLARPRRRQHGPLRPKGAHDLLRRSRREGPGCGATPDGDAQGSGKRTRDCGAGAAGRASSRRGDARVVWSGRRGRRGQGQGQGGRNSGTGAVPTATREDHQVSPLGPAASCSHLTRTDVRHASSSWAFVSATQLLLGDIYGKLLFVEIALASSGALCGLRAIDLGDTTSPTAIVPVSPSTVYLASRFGDSQLVQLPKSLVGGAEGGDAMQQDDDSEEPDLELVASFANLAPIVDCAVVGGEGGAASESPPPPLNGCERANQNASDLDSDQLLVLGFFNETRVFRLSAAAAADDSGDGEIEEVELPPFAADTATLLAGNLGSVLVQVTANGVGFSTPDGAQHGRWLSGGKGKITTAAIKGEQLVVALEGGQLALLGLQDGSLVESSATTLPNDVASVSIATTDSASFVVVGLWASQTVHLLSLPSFETCFTQTLDTTYLIRSVLVTSFADGTSTLFAGLGDGSLTTFAVDLGAKSIDAGSAKTVVLGKKPLLLFEHEQDGGGGGKSVFAVSERLTLVTKPKDRIVYSSVNVEDALAIAPLSTPAYPSALAIASSTSLRLGRIDALQSQQLDIRTVPLDEDEPRRIAYDAENRTFCVLCSRRDVDRTTGETTTAGSVRLLSEENFSTRATAPLAPSEEGQSLTTVRLDSSSVFAIGTAVLDSGTPEPEKGRLLVLRQPDLDTLEQVAEVEIPGCPYALADLGDGFIAAAINSQVAVYLLDPAAGSLSLVATWSGAFIALTLAPGPSSTLLVGDALRSITLLRFSSSPRPKLDELAKDYASRYMVGVEALGGDAHEFLGAETDLNLFTVQRTDEQAAQRSLEDAGTLHPAGAFHLGELVSRFRHGNRRLRAAVRRSLDQHRRGAARVGVRHVGGLDRRHGRARPRGVEAPVGPREEPAGRNSFRAYKSNRRTLPSAGFVDGSFVELFLDLTVEAQDAVLEGRSAAERIGVARGEVVRVLEDVARLH
ncbi:SPOSA6832_03869, partial [Sporobolomyces salmonicolor]